MLRLKRLALIGLQTALAAWRQGNFVEVVDQFNDQFTFKDHALELEFKDKKLLTEFLTKGTRTVPGLRKKGQHHLQQWKPRHQ